MYCPRIAGEECDEDIRRNCDVAETSCSPLYKFEDPVSKNLELSKDLMVNTKSMSFFFKAAAEGKWWRN